MSEELFKMFQTRGEANKVAKQNNLDDPDWSYKVIETNYKFRSNKSPICYIEITDKADGFVIGKL